MFESFRLKMTHNYAILFWSFKKTSIFVLNIQSSAIIWLIFLFSYILFLVLVLTFHLLASFQQESTCESEWDKLKNIWKNKRKRDKDMHIIEWKLPCSINRTTNLPKLESYHFKNNLIMRKALLKAKPSIIMDWQFGMLLV